MAIESRGNTQTGQSGQSGQYGSGQSGSGQSGSGQSGSGQSGQASQTGSFSHATSAVNTAGSAAHGAVEQVIAKVKSTTDSIRESAHGAVDKAVGATTPAARWLEEREIYAKEKEEALVKATSDWVLAHPVKSLGIAFVTGLLIGRITS